MKRQRIGPIRFLGPGFLLAIAAIALAVLLGIEDSSQTLRAQEAAKPKYVGSEVCKGCHQSHYDTWKFTAHRQTNVRSDRPESEQGCEACHGPGGRHVEEGGGKGTMISFDRTKPTEITKICLRCHSQRDVTLWPTSYHAQNKLACTTCHSGHVASREQLLKDIDATRNTIKGLTADLKESELWVKSTVPGSPEHQEALDKQTELDNKKAKIKQELSVVEGRYRRYYEPDQCLGCHKKLQVQINMQSRHPLLEHKIWCSDCHNPHGGPGNSLREERVTELCYKCHGQYEGPFVFEHPPVTEDCTICHQPHGSPHNNLLIQNEPFLCLKCHAGPHSRNQTFANPALIGQFYNRCTGCHNQIHGSDRHPPLHY